jgi:hypothetical protein
MPFECVLLAGLGDQGGNGGERLGHVRLRERLISMGQMIGYFSAR